MMILRVPYLSENPVWHNGATAGTFAGITAGAVVVLLVVCYVGDDYAKERGRGKISQKKTDAGGHEYYLWIFPAISFGIILL